MGLYNGSGGLGVIPNTVLPAALLPGDSVYLWGLSYNIATGPVPGQIQAPNDTNVLFEAVAVGNRSLACQLAARPGGGAPNGAMVQVWANANPGVMEVDVQDAAVDADGNYITNASATNAWKLTTWTGPLADGSYTGWTELQPEGSGFLTLKCITNPNGVKLKCKVTYV